MSGAPGCRATSRGAADPAQRGRPGVGCGACAGNLFNEDGCEDDLLHMFVKYILGLPIGIPHGPESLDQLQQIESW